MRNLLALAAAVVLAVAGLGWYLGWYHVRTTPTADGHREIKIDVDTKKVSDSVHQGTQKVEDFLKKEFQSPPSTSPQQVHPQGPTGGAQGRFRYNSDGSVEYTGEISTPVPISNK
jgi:hypothetical protein